MEANQIEQTEAEPVKAIIQTQREECPVDDAELNRIVEAKRREFGIDDFTNTPEKLSPTIPKSNTTILTPQAQAERDEHAAKERRLIAITKRQMTWQRLVDKRGSRYGSCRLSTFQKSTDQQIKAVETLSDFCTHMTANFSEGAGLILYGPKGTGKDHLAMACARAAIASDLRIEWVNGLDLFAEFRDAMDGGGSEAEIIAKYSKSDILYLSDPLPPIGALTEFQAGVLFRIFDRRYSHRRPVWVTVNVADGEELDARMGPQNGDRLRDGSVAIFCNWPTARRAKQ